MVGTACITRETILDSVGISQGQTVQIVASCSFITFESQTTGRVISMCSSVVLRLYCSLSYVIRTGTQRCGTILFRQKQSSTYTTSSRLARTGDRRKKNDAISFITRCQQPQDTGFASHGTKLNSRARFNILNRNNCTCSYLFHRRC